MSILHVFFGCVHMCAFRSHFASSAPFDFCMYAYTPMLTAGLKKDDLCKDAEQEDRKAANAERMRVILFSTKRMRSDIGRLEDMLLLRPPSRDLLGDL